jgi:hypothetical protein
MELCLVFEGAQLDRIRFCHLRRPSRESFRGRSRFHKTAGSFSWSSAVKFTVLLFITEQIARIENEPEAKLVGKRGTPASVLDYALDRQPVWIKEVFGVDKEGVSFLHSLIQRSNSRPKEDTEITVTMRKNRREDTAIRIFIDSIDISNNSKALRQLAVRLQEPDAIDLPSVANG